MEKIGIDLGNVIIDHVGFGTTAEYFATGDYNLIPPVKDSLFALSQLNKKKFENNVFVIYNATDIADNKIISWLNSHNFFYITGIEANKVIRSKKGRDKLQACIENEINYFVDDRLEVLGNLHPHVQNLFLLGGQSEEILQFQEIIKKVNVVSDWDSLLKQL